MISWLVAAAALLVGAGLGLLGLLAPARAAKLVKLQESDAGGFAEFRATFGGVFFGLHAVGFAGVLATLSGAPGAQAFTLGALGCLAAGWIGAAAGRILSMAADKTNTGFNRVSVLVELALGLAHLAPFLALT